ncbi:MAG: hypothetical protein P4L50_07755 [Anaerolineaceae bacterium]|nr:hypothetical protein [Anaerolineaceae bacterium]
MNRTFLFQRLIHLPRRIVREFLMVAHLVQFFFTNRFGRTPATSPGYPVVSLTTYGARSKKVYFAIESIANGDVRPSRLILWIDDELLFNNLPSTLRRLQRRGLEVMFCKNYGPHTKYYPYVESTETFDIPLVTADDDVLYPKYWLKKLVEANREFPENVNCFWCHVIAIDENGIEKSHDWRQCDSTQPRSRHVAAGIAGVIYPPAFLMELKRTGRAFETCCPKADDIWLHVQALRSGYKVRQIFPHLPYWSFRGIPGTQNTALCNYNVDGFGNDQQISATYSDADVRKLRADS